MKHIIIIVLVAVALGAIVASTSMEAMTCYPGQHVDDTGVCVDSTYVDPDVVVDPDVDS